MISISENHDLFSFILSDLFLLDNIILKLTETIAFLSQNITSNPEKH